MVSQLNRITSSNRRLPAACAPHAQSVGGGAHFVEVNKLVGG